MCERGKDTHKEGGAFGVNVNDELQNIGFLQFFVVGIKFAMN